MEGGWREDGGGRASASRRRSDPARRRPLDTRHAARSNVSVRADLIFGVVASLFLAASGAHAQPTRRPLEGGGTQTAFRAFLHRFCTDDDFAWDHTRLPLRVEWFDNEAQHARVTTLRRSTRYPSDHFVFCNDPDGRSPEQGRMRPRGPGYVVEWRAYGGSASMAFELFQGAWRLIQCHLCGMFNGSY